MQMTLDRLAVGESGVVTGITGEGAVRRRLFDMGLTPGAHVTVRRVAPLGDPIELSVRGYALSMRRAQAKAVQVDVPRKSRFSLKGRQP